MREDTPDSWVYVDVIDGYAFSYSDTVYYIKIGDGVAVNANAFYLIGEQLQHIDLTEADVELFYNKPSDVDGSAVHAFAVMPRCPLYVKSRDFYIPTDGSKGDFIFDEKEGIYKPTPIPGTGTHLQDPNGITAWRKKFPNTFGIDDTGVMNWFIVKPYYNEA
jgi:hypothetical protein